MGVVTKTKTITILVSAIVTVNVTIKYKAFYELLEINSVELFGDDLTFVFKDSVIRY